MHNINLIIVFLFLIAPISNILHEIGHMIGAIIVKSDNMILTIGKGKKVLTVPLKKLVIHVHRVFFIGGHAASKRHNPYKPLEMILITFCGPLLNILIGLSAYLLFRAHMSDYVLLFILFNLWLGLTNLIPFKIKGKYSDGYLIFKTLIEP